MAAPLRRLKIKEGSLSRRLGRNSLFRSAQVHPYRYVQEPRNGPKFRVCLHSAGLPGASRGSAAARRLLGDAPSQHVEAFRTPGDVDDVLAIVPAMALSHKATQVGVALEAFGHLVETAVIHPEQWYEVAETLTGSRTAGNELIEVEAAEALHAHLFVTESQALLDLREKSFVQVDVLTPAEALPVIWAWMRGFGDHWDGRAVTSSADYYWALARALTPSTHDAFAALVMGEYIHPSGEALVDLAQSALTRLSTAIEDLDDIYRAWQLPTDNRTVDRICGRFDRVVLEVAAIFDNLALLATEYFGITGLKPFERSFSNKALLAKLKGHTDTRATGLGAYIDANRAYVTLHTELRHHAIHRARLTRIRYQHERDPEEVRVRITEPALSAVWDGLVKAGQDPAEWGLSNREGPRDEPVGLLDEPDRTETRHSPGDALLDPMAFAPRLIAATIVVINDVHDRLELARDESLVGRKRARRRAVPPEEWPLRPQDRETLLLTSPLAGMTF